MPIAETIAALKGALDVSKIVNDLVNRSDIDVVEVRSKVHQMLIHVVNAQTGLAETQMEIYDLQQQLNDRERLRIIEADLDRSGWAVQWVCRLQNLDGYIRNEYADTEADCSPKIFRRMGWPSRLTRFSGVLRRTT